MTQQCISMRAPKGPKRLELFWAMSLAVTAGLLLFFGALSVASGGSVPDRIDNEIVLRNHSQVEEVSPIYGYVFMIASLALWLSMIMSVILGAIVFFRGGMVPPIILVTEKKRILKWVQVSLLVSAGGLLMLFFVIWFFDKH